jgi:hypothetical protein
MKYAVEMDSGAMICISDLINIHSGNKSCWEGGSLRHIDNMEIA